MLKQRAFDDSVNMTKRLSVADFDPGLVAEDVEIFRVERLRKRNGKSAVCISALNRKRLFCRYAKFADCRIEFAAVFHLRPYHAVERAAVNVSFPIITKSLPSKSFRSKHPLKALKSM